MEAKYRVGDRVEVKEHITSENTHWADDEIKKVCSPIVGIYKVGDKVRIKSELWEGVSYGGVGFLELMNKYKGKVVEVKEKIGVNYRLTNCDNWIFSETMLEPAEEPVITKEKSKILKLFL